MKLNDTNIAAVAAAMHLGEVQVEGWKALFGLSARESETIEQMMFVGRPEITQSPLAPLLQSYFDLPNQPARLWEFLERPIRLGILWHHAAIAPQRYLTSRLQQLSDLLPYALTDQTVDSTAFLFRLTSMLKVILFDAGLLGEAYRQAQRQRFLAVAESPGTSCMFSGSTRVDNASDFQLLTASPPRAMRSKPRKTCLSTEDEVRVEVADLDVDENEARRCKALAGLTKFDIKLLRQLHEPLSEARSQIANAAVVQITSFWDNSDRLLDAARLESLRHAISDSLDRMTAGKFNQKAWGPATHSGVVYSRLDLDITSLISVCCKSIVDLLGAAHLWLTSERKPVLPTFQALLKSFMVEIGIVLDVLIRADARPLLDLQTRARATVAQLPWAVLTVYPDLRLQSANNAFLTLFDYASRADIAGQRLDEVLPSDDLAEQVRAFFAARLPRFNLFLDVATKSGVRHLRVVITGLIQREQVRCVLLIEDCTQVQRLEQRRTHSVQQQRSLAEQVIAAEETVRRQIGYDLHDELGQSLTALSMDLSRLEVEGDAETVKRLRFIVASALDELRRLSRGLTAKALDEQGLLEALQQYAAFYSEVHAIPVDMQVGPFPAHRLPQLVEKVLYRIVLEALTNVAKHAACKHVELLIECQPTVVQLIVRDDGVGFDLEAAAQRTASAAIGLTSMRERTGLLNGSFVVDTQPGQGTSICVQLPLTQEDP